MEDYFMNKKYFTISIIAAAVVLLCGITYSSYNKLVLLDEETSSAWSQVENQYQRRYDLIPNLVNTVKGYAKHEESVLRELTEARSKAGGVISVDSSILDDPEKMAEFQKVQNELGASLQRLLAVTENYPELKANQNFLALQDELEGTENRISVERKRFNYSVKAYNSTMRRFPMNLLAGMFGFEKKNYFAAEAAAAKAPEVQF